MIGPALGLDLSTPQAFRTAISAGTDPSAADKAFIDRRWINVYVYNSQNATPGRPAAALYRTPIEVLSTSDECPVVVGQPAGPRCGQPHPRCRGSPMGRAPRRDEARGMTASPVVSGRSLAYCAALIPLAVWAVIAALCGRAEAAAQRWSRFRTRMLKAPPPRATHRPGILAIAGHAVLSILLGAAALVPLGIEYLFVARGVFYGLTDPGPYDHSWGGPTRGGAWLVHFLITVPLAGAGILVLAGIAAVHQRLTVGLTGRRPGPWPIAATVLLAAGAVAFFIAWLRQL